MLYPIPLNNIFPPRDFNSPLFIHLRNIKRRLQNQKKYFYNEYKEYLEAVYLYQGYNLLKYEEIIKRMLKEGFKYSTEGSNFNYKTDYQSEYSEQYPVRDLFYNESIEDKNRTDILYFYCKNKNEAECLKNKYE